MQPEPPPGRPILKRILLVLGVAVGIAALYDGWVFYSRWSSTRDAARADSQKDAEKARETLNVLGNGEFKILEFYAVPGVTTASAGSNVCYGTSEAKSVRIDPPVENLYPTLAHCIQVYPRKTTTYTLTADDGKGHTVTQSLTLQVTR